ncbi:MAG: iron-containing alcohol dehydrogenase, partial [Polaribacter sp.]|nr:iron-containing alcohol dehydrogenase [Polaribacter sp.]
ETKEKIGMGGPGLFPQFSVLDPEVVTSIPKRQLANGLADSFTHVLEQYMTFPIEAKLQDRFAESILQTLVEIAPTLLNDTFDYKTASNFMWSCTMALNGLIQQGVPSDWSIHMMGHELTALYGIDHARTLAILTESHYKVNLEDKKEKLAQYAERVWNITDGTLEEKAFIGIEKTSAFFKSLGIDIKLSNYTNNYDGTAEIISERFKERGWLGIGERGKVTPEMVKKIIEMSY